MSVPARLLGREPSHPIAAHDIDAARRGEPGARPTLIGARVLTGGAVVNPAGTDLGTIESIMLDVASGQIAYAVLSFGGFLGLGSKLFALPWGALTLDRSGKRFILEASTEQLEKAQGFDEDHWPSMADPDWALRLHSHYNVPPYWHATPVPAIDAGTAGARKDGGAERTGLHY